MRGAKQRQKVGVKGRGRGTHAGVAVMGVFSQDSIFLPQRSFSWQRAPLARRSSGASRAQLGYWARHASAKQRAPEATLARPAPVAQASVADAGCASPSGDGQGRVGDCYELFGQVAGPSGKRSSVGSTRQGALKRIWLQYELIARTTTRSSSVVPIHIVMARSTEFDLERPSGEASRRVRPKLFG